VGAILRHRILAPLVLSIVLLIVQVALIRFVPPAGVFFYYVTVGILELLEAGGVRTLAGSPDGWPVPTDLGFAIAAVGWFLVYFVFLAVFVRVVGRRTAVANRPKIMP
jgi:hypothetical protein